MAQYAANFTTTLQNKPSILEIIAQESLNNALYPSLQRIALSLHPVVPEKYSWIYEHHEIFLIVTNSLMQYYYFKVFDSSFSESFYGLKRVSINGQTLSESYKILSAVYLSVLPYLKSIIFRRYHLYKTQDVEGSLGEAFSDKIKKLFILTYPFMEMIWGTWLLASYLRYMSDKQESQSPTLFILKSKLIYSETVKDTGFWIPLVRNQLSWGDFRKGILINVTTRLLEILAFSMQFVQCLNNIAPNFKFTALPLIPVPMADNKADHFKDKCPICRQYWKLPAVLTVSGYVFCFTCILKHLRKNQNCPVTHLPAKPLDIIRLFDGA